MKTCQICGETASESTITCGACGEGSFVSEARSKAQERDEPEQSEQPVQSRKGRR